jgi:NAD(P)-binding Rossmann-like domain
VACCKDVDTVLSSFGSFGMRCCLGVPRACPDKELHVCRYTQSNWLSGSCCRLALLLQRRQVNLVIPALSMVLACFWLLHSSHSTILLTREGHLAQHRHPKHARPSAKKSASTLVSPPDTEDGSRTTSHSRTSSSGRQHACTETEYDAVVIGGGMGGLTTAAQMASKGASVLVLEK